MDTVFCLVRDKAQAHRLIDSLLNAGFAQKDVSLLGAEKHGLNAQGGDTNLSTDDASKAPEGATTGGLTGGIIGGTLGLLAGLGSLAIPGLGALVAAGPLLGALAGSGVGGATGMLVGALIGYGIPEYEAKNYEEGVKSGKILISVNAATSDQVDKAKDLMRNANADSISSTIVGTSGHEHGNGNGKHLGSHVGGTFGDNFGNNADTKTDRF